ncbi:hypothetical protein C8R47DRAFT_1072325 [Mycena vitilis]|nr:hypothetical protein C8R47DRAFT_1072325 [Mycena vitilis]
MSGRQTRSGNEFSPFALDQLTPYRTDRVSIRELLVRRAEARASDDEGSLTGSEDSDEDHGRSSAYTRQDASTSAAQPTDFQRWVTPPAPPAPKPFLAKGIRCARPNAPLDLRPPTFTHWIVPPAPPAPRPYLANVIRCAPPSRPLRTEAQERQRLKKRKRDRQVRLQHREELRVKAGRRLKGVAHLRVRQSLPVRLKLNLEEYDLPVASSGWMGRRQDEPDQRAYGLEELTEGDDPFDVYQWNGAPQPVVDRDNTVILVLGGFPPNAVDWQDAVAEPAAEAMRAAAAEIYTEPKWRRKAAADAEKMPRRGPHAAESIGISMGGGQPYPMQLQHSVTNTAIMMQLFGLKCFERIAGWTNIAPWTTVFAWDATRERTTRLRRNFNRAFSVFAAATFNFGPRTVTFPHIDFGNLAWGWCPVTALGKFDPDFGGHLILWDLKLIIRFPPGSTIIIPSAILRHSNVKIRPWETRYSFTQFTPAGIFRFMYNGCRTDKDVELSTTTTREEFERRRQDRMKRWQDGVGMYRVWNDSPNAERQ